MNNSPCLHKSVLPVVLMLAKSPLLKGGALSAMLEFFKMIVSAGGQHFNIFLDHISSRKVMVSF